jgi:hypothetical protein
VAWDLLTQIHDRALKYHQHRTLELHSKHIKMIDDEVGERALPRSRFITCMGWLLLVVLRSDLEVHPE